MKNTPAINLTSIRQSISSPGSKWQFAPSTASAKASLHQPPQSPGAKLEAEARASREQLVQLG